MGAHRLSGAGFPDHAEDFSGDEVERNPIDGIGPVAAGRQRQLENTIDVTRAAPDTGDS